MSVAIQLGLSGCAGTESKPDFTPDLLRRPPFAATFDGLQAAASKGDLDAELSLGEAYQSGENNDVDFRAASELFASVAASGNPRAELLMAKLLEARSAGRALYPPDMRGFNDDIAEGVNEDPMFWLASAAQHGLAEAQGALALEVRGHPGEERKWAERAADQADPVGLLVLGEMLTRPLKMARSPVSSGEVSKGIDYLFEASAKIPQAGALYLSRKYAPGEAAFSKGDKEVAFNVDLEEMAYLDAPPDAPMLILGQFLDGMDRAATDKRRSILDIAESSRELDAELARRARAGNARAACNLGFLLTLRQRGGKNPNGGDLSKAAEWYALAARKGASRADYWLGKYYRDRGEPEALRYFYLAARQGYKPALAALGDMILNGVGISADPEAARLWLVPAAAASHPVGLLDLGRIYFEGLGVPRDERRGLALIRRAASNDYGTAARTWLEQHAALGPAFAVPSRLTYGPHPDAAKGGCG